MSQPGAADQGRLFQVVPSFKRAYIEVPSRQILAYIIKV